MKNEHVVFRSKNQLVMNKCRRTACKPLAIPPRLAPIISLQSPLPSPPYRPLRLHLLHSLPKAVLAHVLTFLPPVDHAQLARTHRVLAAVTRLPEAWPTTLVLDRHSDPTKLDAMLRHSAFHPRTVVLDSCSYDETPFLQAVVARCVPFLTGLRMNGLPSLRVGQVLNMMRHCHQLTSLQLKNNAWVADSATLLQFADSVKRLQSLALICDKSCVDGLGHHIRANPSLTSLDVHFRLVAPESIAWCLRKSIDTDDDKDAVLPWTDIALQADHSTLHGHWRVALAPLFDLDRAQLRSLSFYVYEGAHVMTSSAKDVEAIVQCGLKHSLTLKQWYSCSIHSTPTSMQASGRSVDERDDRSLVAPPSCRARITDATPHPVRSFCPLANVAFALGYVACAPRPPASSLAARVSDGGHRLWAMAPPRTSSGTGSDRLSVRARIRLASGQRVSPAFAGPSVVDPPRG